jgi:lipid A 3-O-deacylase
VAPEGGGTYTGASLTPVILRWNFLTRSRRIQPWFQGLAD